MLGYHTSLLHHKNTFTVNCSGRTSLLSVSRPSPRALTNHITGTRRNRRIYPHNPNHPASQLRGLAPKPILACLQRRPGGTQDRRSGRGSVVNRAKSCTRNYMKRTCASSELLGGSREETPSYCRGRVCRETWLRRAAHPSRTREWSSYQKGGKSVEYDLG